MTTTTKTRGAVKTGWWIEVVIGFAMLAAAASIATGGALAAQPDHSWAWLAAGALGGVVFLVAATVLDLLRRIAFNR